MISFKQYMTEARLSLSPEQTLAHRTAIDDAFAPIFKKYFPNGFFNVRESALIGGGTYWVSCGIINELGDQTNRIRNNDPLYMTLNVEFADESLDSGVLQAKNGISISGKPTRSGLVMSSAKIPFRKSSGDIKKLTSAFEKTVKRVRAKYDEMLKDDTLYKTDIKDKYKK